MEAQLAEDPVPPEAPATHIKSPAAAYLERAVHTRRGSPSAVLLDEFDQVITRRITQLRSRPIAPSQSLVSVIDQRPIRADRLLPLRVFDAWAHEQDIRAALARPGNLTSHAADVSWRIIANALPNLIAKIDV